MLTFDCRTRIGLLMPDASSAREIYGQLSGCGCVIEDLQSEAACVSFTHLTEHKPELRMWRKLIDAHAAGAGLQFYAVNGKSGLCATNIRELADTYEIEWSRGRIECRGVTEVCRALHKLTGFRLGGHIPPRLTVYGSGKDNEWYSVRRALFMGEEMFY